MKKIKFTILDKVLVIDYDIENNTIKNINNTNIISNDDLIFDIKYFKNNTYLISGFLSVILKNEDVKNAIINDEDLIIPGLDFLNKLPMIENLLIKPDIPIDYDIHLAILKNDTLKHISCFTIPPYLLERIDTTKNVKIETRNEVFFISNFVRINKLNSYTDVYYKRKLIINYEFRDTDWQDLESFLTINTHLKTIYFEYISMDLIKKLLYILKERDKKNILFDIEGTKDNLIHFNEIENLVKKNRFIRKNKIKFRIDYTSEYKMENFLKLINFTTLKYILIVVIISSVLGYGINYYDIYKSSLEVNDISENISELLEEYRELDPGDENNTDDPAPEETTPTPVTPPKPVIDNTAYYKDYAKVISVLKETNADTVGWLSVNNTNINYPVVQALNNSYYLTHDFTKKSNSMGWIFMDYRNDTGELQQNTIIYGHNISQSSNLMFGSLRNILNESWYTNANNHTITFNTANRDMKWKVFSIYKIANTNDYLYNTFNSQKEFMDFITILKERSIYDFNVSLKEGDKIITLSTCQNSGKYRLVLHAVLLE